ncbi:MAG: outer membrane beta-barrel family protein [Ferruginibacter sp.]
MMTKLTMAFLALWLCFASNFVNAQTLSGKITGNVIDENGSAVDGATVSLERTTDSVAVKYELAAADGSFNLDIKEGSYYLLITSVGKQSYKSGMIAVDAQHLLMKLPAIIMHPATKALQEVVVTGKTPFLAHKVDRTVVNVDALISNAGTTALDVLEKSPGVNIDQGGNISFHGKTGVMVYIDDKPTYLSGSDLENYLRSMPSSMLSQIELMTNPPAKYDAAGTAGIINIKTKKIKVKGFNLGISLSLRQSRYTTTNNSLDFNYRKDKVNVFGTFGYTLINKFNDIDINRQYFYNGGQPSGSFSQKSYIRNTGSGYSTKLGMDIYASEKTTIGVLLNGVMRSPNENNNSYGRLFNAAGQPDSSVISRNKEQRKFKNGSANLNYKHTFKKDGPEISANLDYLAFATNNNQLFLNQTSNTAGTFLSNDQLNGNLPTAIHIYSASADYSVPLAAAWKLEAGAKSSYTNTNNQANYFNTVGGNSVPDYDKTNHFLYKEAINAGYVNLNKDFKRLSVQAGVRLENTNSSGHQLGNIQKPDSAFNRNYTSLFPTLYLLYKLDTLGDHQLKLTYGRRIERPYYQDLNPFISPLDKYTFYIGNPYLLPSYSGNVELGYIYKDRITVTLNYIDIRDRVTETIEIRNGFYYDRPGNIGSTKLYDLNVDAGFEPTSWFSLQLSGDVWHVLSVSEFYTGILDNNSTNFSGQAMLQFKLKNGWSLQTDGKYQSKQSDAQFLVSAKGRLNVAVSKVLSPRATLKLSINDLLYTNINQGAIENLYQTKASFRTLSDTRAAQLTLSMRFGKSVTGQRKHNQTGAGDENERVKN